MARQDQPIKNRAVLILLRSAFLSTTLGIFAHCYHRWKWSTSLTISMYRAVMWCHYETLISLINMKDEGEVYISPSTKTTRRATTLLCQHRFIACEIALSSRKLIILEQLFWKMRSIDLPGWLSPVELLGSENERMKFRFSRKSSRNTTPARLLWHLHEQMRI